MNDQEPRSLGRSTLLSLGVAVAYAVTGKLSLLFAIPPGYATAIWPPSGIALAAVLLIGYRVWPGVLFGSILINVSTGFDASTVSTILWSITVPIGIGSGAALQAVVGAFCVRRYAGFPNPLANEREVFLFLFWGGPASCLVNSIIGSTVLLVAGVIPASNFLINSGTWWIGDTIGVVIFAPLVLIWTLRPRELWKSRRLIVSVPIAIVFALVVAAVGFGANWERGQLTLQFERQATALAGALEKSLISYVAVLHSLESFYAASANIDRSEFRTFVARPFTELTGLQALSWNPRVLGSERDEFENGTRQEGFPNFQITERNAEGQLVRATRRPEHISVHFIEPFEGNEKAFGYDVASNPTRREAMALARDTGKPIATARITLVQETGRQFGVLVFMPVYGKGLPHDTLERRRRNLAGFMVGVFRGGNIVKSALQDWDQEGLIYRLLDETAPAGEQFLFENQPQGHGIVTLEEKGIFGGSMPIGRNFPIVVGGRQWRFEVTPSQEYLARHRQEYAWLILIAGMLLTSLVGSFVLVVSGRSELLRSLVAERTHYLTQSEKQVRAIVDNANDGIITTNDQGIIQSANPATEIIFGYSCEDLIGQNVSILTPEPHRSSHDTYIANYLDTGGANIIGIGREVEGQRKDGASVVLDLSISEFFVGENHLFLGMVRDISERKEMDRMKSEFVSTVSHELRTPLTSIKGSLGLVAGGALGALPEKAKGMVAVANKNTERLIDLVNDILDMEKLQSDRMEFDFQPLDLSGLVTEAVETNEGFAKEHGVTFVLGDLASEVAVRGDGNRLTQVISNLLSNAAKFSPQGGEVGVLVVRRDGVARVLISDYGPGIPEGFREHIFGRFAQADGSDTRQKGGTGLGLNISKSIVEKHGGTVGFDSEVGVGTTFYFDLPELGVRKEEQTPSVESTVSVDASRGKDFCVLVCEDDPDVAKILSTTIEQAGFSADIAYDADEAVDMLAHGRYDAMTVDIMLPGKDGLSLIRELRCNKETKDLPIVVVSAKAAEARRKESASPLAVVDWLEKPLDKDRLLEAVGRAARRIGPSNPRVLYVEDDTDLTDITRALLDSIAEIVSVGTLAEARERLRGERFDLVILDIGLPDGSGLDLLDDIHPDENSPLPVIIFSAQEVTASVEAKVEAALVKSRTTNEKLVETVMSLIPLREIASDDQENGS